MTLPPEYNQAILEMSVIQNEFARAALKTCRATGRVHIVNEADRLIRERPARWARYVSAYETFYRDTVGLAEKQGEARQAYIKQRFIAAVNYGMSTRLSSNARDDRAVGRLLQIP